MILPFRMKLWSHRHLPCLGSQPILPTKVHKISVAMIEKRRFENWTNLIGRIYVVPLNIEFWSRFDLTLAEEALDPRVFPSPAETFSCEIEIGASEKKIMLKKETIIPWDCHLRQLQSPANYMVNTNLVLGITHIRQLSSAVVVPQASWWPASSRWLASLQLTCKWSFVKFGANDNCTQKRENCPNKYGISELLSS